MCELLTRMGRATSNFFWPRPLVVLLALSTLKPNKWVKSYSYKSKRESNVFEMSYHVFGQRSEYDKEMLLICDILLSERK